MKKKKKKVSQRDRRHHHRAERHRPATIDNITKNNGNQLINPSTKFIRFVAKRRLSHRDLTAAASFQTLSDSFERESKAIFNCPTDDSSVILLVHCFCAKRLHEHKHKSLHCLFVSLNQKIV
jgi:hypothetical protein